MRKHPLISTLLILISLVFFIPLWLLTVQALIPINDAMLISMYAEPLRLYIDKPVIEQFEQLINKYTNISNVISRDVIWCIASASIQVFISVITGYILAKHRSHFSMRIVLLFTLTLVLPMQMFLIPVYRVTEWIGMAGNPIFMYMMRAFSPLGAILMRQIYIRMPDEYIEFFRLEDNRMSQLIYHIVFPIGIPVAGLLFLLSFVETWSMVEQPLILLPNKQQHPLSMILYELRLKEPGFAYAASLYAFIPVGILLLMFLPLYIRYRLKVKPNNYINANIYSLINK